MNISISRTQAVEVKYSNNKNNNSKNINSTTPPHCTDTRITTANILLLLPRASYRQTYLETLTHVELLI